MVAIRLSAFGLIALAAGAAFAQSESWDQNVKRLCNSVDQKDCWVKAGAVICDRGQVHCTTLADHTPARVLRKESGLWYVQTPSGFGWVSGRMMMMDAGAMR